MLVRTRQQRVLVINTAVSFANLIAQCRSLQSIQQMMRQNKIQGQGSLHSTLSCITGVNNHVTADIIALFTLVASHWLSVV